MEPGLSFIIPVHNGAATLHACLTSVLGQRGVAPTEVIVVENGSTDHTLSVLEHFPQVQVLKSGTLGRARARNLGAGLARYDHLAFVDCDVVLPPDWAQTVARSLVGPFSIGQTRIQVELTHPVSRWLFPRLGQHFLSRDSAQLTIDSAAMMVLTVAFREVGGFDERLPRWEDTALTLSLVNRGHSPVVLSGPLVRKREDRGPWERILRGLAIGQTEFRFRREWHQLPALRLKTVLKICWQRRNLSSLLHWWGGWWARAPVAPPRHPMPTGWRAWWPGQAVSKAVVVVAAPEFIVLRTSNCQVNLVLAPHEAGLGFISQLISEGRPFLRELVSALEQQKDSGEKLKFLQQRMIFDAGPAIMETSPKLFVR